MFSGQICVSLLLLDTYFSATQALEPRVLEKNPDL